MLEKLLISLATTLLERVGKWLLSKYKEGRANAREDIRIGRAVDVLVQAKTHEEVVTAFDNLP